MTLNTIKSEERIIFALRSIYDKYGYSRYKMNKFEEYDLYVRNKDFLISDSVITFTDTNGKLMALKPDVTLSIVKNTRDLPGSVQKVYYNENVYRVAKSSRSFREIMQAGLECIGDIDDYCIYEVLSLAAQSLAEISVDSVLNIAHIGVLETLLAGVHGEQRAHVLSCIRDKNTHELAQACKNAGLDPQRSTLLELLITSYGRAEIVLPALEKAMGDNVPLRQLKTITDAFVGTPTASMLRIDFSVVNDSIYYNGIVFKGFVSGVPSSVLSGGQYDKLMRKMGRRSGAIGFAVYLDQLERINETESLFDADVVLLYDEQADIAGLSNAVNRLNSDGCRVSVLRSKPETLRCRTLARYKNGEVEILENNA